VRRESNQEWLLET